MDTFLDKVRDLVPFLQIFTIRVRSDLLTHNGGPVRLRTAEAYLRAVGQTFSNVGIGDPRLNKHGSIDYRLQRQVQGWTKSDGPPEAAQTHLYWDNTSHLRGTPQKEQQ